MSDPRPVPRPPHAILDAPRALVFAHRGGALDRPENTMAAFEHGLALGADGLELDVQLSADDVVVCHDERLERTTNRRGSLRDHSADDLSAVDAAWRFGEDDGFPLRGSGIGIPRLRDVLERFPAASLIVELKGGELLLAARAVEIVRAAGALARVCFASFSDAMVGAARACGEGVVTSAGVEEIRWALYRSWLALGPRRPAFGAIQVPERYGATRVVSRRFVRAMSRARIPVHVWTVNDPADMRRLLAWGVKGLITDRPDLAARAVRERDGG